MSATWLFGQRKRDFLKPALAAITTQSCCVFPVGDMQGHLNLRGFGEFGAKNRPEGWNVWLTFAISPSAETHVAAKPVIRK
jgi:hypothetical protein